MCEASGGPGSHFLSPLAPRLVPSVALFNPQCCSALTFLTKSSPSLSLPLHSSLFSAFLFHFKLLFYSNLILLLSTTCFFSPQRATIRPPPCLGLRPRHPIHIAFFFMVFPIFVCALNPSPASTLCTIAPPPSHPPEPPPPPSSLAGHRPDAQPRAGRRGPVLLGLAGPPQQRAAAGALLRPVGGLGLWLHLDEPQLPDGLGAAQELHLPPELRKRDCTATLHCNVTYGALTSYLQCLEKEKKRKKKVGFFIYLFIFYDFIFALFFFR